MTRRRSRRLGRRRSASASATSSRSTTCRSTCDAGELFGLIGPGRRRQDDAVPHPHDAALPDAGTRDGARPRRRAGPLGDPRRASATCPGASRSIPISASRRTSRFFASVFGTTIEAGTQLIAPIYTQLEPFARSARGRALRRHEAEARALLRAGASPGASCFSTSRPPASTPSRAASSGICSRRCKASGLTIVVSTPYMDEATRCDRVALIQRGRILDDRPPAAIGARFDRPLLAVRRRERYALLHALRAVPARALRLSRSATQLHYTDERADGTRRQRRGELQRVPRGAGAFADAAVDADRAPASRTASWR